MSGGPTVSKVRSDADMISPALKPMSRASKFKLLVFAVLIIFGVGGLTVAGIGVSGLVKTGFSLSNAGALTNLAQLSSITLIVVGSGVGIPSLIIGTLGFVSVYFGFFRKTRSY